MLHDVLWSKVLTQPVLQLQFIFQTKNVKVKEKILLLYPTDTFVTSNQLSYSLRAISNKST